MKGGNRTRELSRHPVGHRPMGTLVAVTSPPIAKGVS